MSLLPAWIQKPLSIFMLCTMLYLFSLPAQAEFYPDKGITVTHWKEPDPNLNLWDSYWQDDHTLVRLLRVSDIGQDGYIRQDVRTGDTQSLDEFTKIVRGTEGSFSHIPRGIIPSPDGKYLAWIAQGNGGDYCLAIATSDGSLISRQTSKMRIDYPAWSSDSRWCYCFIEGRVAEHVRAREGTLADNGAGFIAGREVEYDSERAGFVAIAAIDIKTPSVIKTYPIAMKSEGQQSALTGYLSRPCAPNGPYTSDGPGDPALSDFHWRGANITLLSPQGDLRTIIFEEFRLADTSRIVERHTILMPEGWAFESADFSPSGDAIAWKIQREDYVEIWISDGKGRNLRRIGKFYPGDPGSATHIWTGYLEPHTLKWLPNGKAISFQQAGEAYVVSTSFAR